MLSAGTDNGNGSWTLTPAQLSGLAWLFGGFHWTRIWHFVSMCGFLAFLPGHLVMVAIHGWSNFAAMLTGWKADPEYLRPAPVAPVAPPPPPPSGETASLVE